jgi:hypothetical protein
VYCPDCGAQNPDDAQSCSECGRSLAALAQGAPESPVATTTPTSSMALVSLILGILGWVVLPLIGSILAVVFGHVALGEIDRSGGQLGGRGMAQVGLILGYAALGLEVLSVLLFVVLPVVSCGFCSICGAWM